jgi:branched-chain amino acid transport system substrate-binding protein
MTKGISRRSAIVAGFALTALLAASPALAQKKNGPGVTDTEVKIGNIMPYSGPASSYGMIGKTEQAYIDMINASGGVNGRKITFISYDDGYSPPKAVEQARKLVESDEVAFLFNPLGTPSNTAIIKYMNAKKVPHLFLATGATIFGQHAVNPWTMGFQPNYQSEGRIYAKYVANNFPNAKIGILYQNDDFGKDMVKGFKDGLGAKASLIVAEAPYEIADPTVDSQILKLKAAGVDLLYDSTTPKFGAMVIKKLAEIGWKPTHILGSVAASVGSVIKPAGFANAQGVISAAYAKDPDDPKWKDDAGVKNWSAFLDKWMPGANKSDGNHVYGYNASQTLITLLKMCGDDLTRENIMKQAQSLKNVQLEMLLPGITLNTSATDYYPIEQMQLMKFEGERWVNFGDIITGEIGGK